MYIVLTAYDQISQHKCVNRVFVDCLLVQSIPMQIIFSICRH